MKINYLVILFLSFLLSACSEQTSDKTQTSEIKDATQAIEIPHSTSTQTDDEDLYASMRGTSEVGEDHPGNALYQEHCAACHSYPVSRAPHLSFLQMLPGDMILHTLNEGAMQAMAAKMSSEEKQQVAEFIAGSTESKNQYPLLMCSADKSAFDYSSHPFAKGWGIDLRNSRFIPSEVARLDKICQAG